MEERRRIDDPAGDGLVRLAIEAAPVGMVMIDPQGTIVLANAELERLFGYPRGDLVGRQVEVLVPERYRPLHVAYRAEYTTRPHARAMAGNRDLYGLRKDGVEVPVEIRLNPLATPTGAYVLSSIVDITERRRAATLLEASLREKETLLREVHHRVKNNLQVISSLLSLQASHKEGTELEALLRESQSRVHSVALVHEMLYRAPSLAHIRFGDYLQTLVEHVSAVAAGVQGIRVIVQADDLPLPLDAAVPCGLIVNELVTNALKHAYVGRTAGAVRVYVRRDGATATVGVADDGNGLPTELDPLRSPSMGLRLVTTLARQLGATLTVERSAGLRVELRLPLPAEGGAHAA